MTLSGIEPSIFRLVAQCTPVHCTLYLCWKQPISSW